MRTHSLVWQHNRVTELACISQKYQRGDRIAAAEVKQWGHIVARLTSTKGLPQVVRRIGAEWAKNVDSIAARVLGHDTDVLQGIAAVAMCDAATWKEHAQASAAS